MRLARIARALAEAHGLDFAGLSDEERDALRAFAAHVRLRATRTDWPAFDPGGETFVTVGYMQDRLAEAHSRRVGEKAARKARRILLALGVIVDTGKVKRPRKSDEDLARREKFQPGEVDPEGGASAQESVLRSRWWPVYVVPAIAEVLRIAEAVRGAYGQLLDVPEGLRCLSALAVRQGLIPRPQRRRHTRPGSVQHAFAHCGPP